MLFEHYKGGLYELIASHAKLESTGEAMVVYKCLSSKTLYVRPLQEFIEKIETAQGIVSRFQLQRSNP